MRYSGMLQHHHPKEVKHRSRIFQVCSLFWLSFHRLPFDSIQDSDDDIVMPEGPPPGVEEESVGSDDDIPMPEGPPPGKEQGAHVSDR